MLTLSRSAQYLADASFLLFAGRLVREPLFESNASFPSCVFNDVMRVTDCCHTVHSEGLQRGSSSQSLHEPRHRGLLAARLAETSRIPQVAEDGANQLDS